MDKEILKKLKIKLEEQRAWVIQQLESVGDRKDGAEVNFDAKFPQYGDSVEDSAVEVADYTKNLSLEKDLEKELKDISGALKKIEDGTYGVCKYCHKVIELERLEIRPESSSCVSCKKALKGEK
jgi:RNA polymerase-binding transcription factor DksA